MTSTIAQAQLSKLIRERDQMRGEITEREAGIQVHNAQIAALDKLIADTVEATAAPQVVS